MTPQALAAIAAAILSLLFSYVPGFKSWYQPLETTYKRLVMLALVCLSAAGVFGLACAGWGDQLNLNLTCSPESALGMVSTLLGALAANQAVFLISPKPARRESRAYLDKHPDEPELSRELSERHALPKVQPSPEDRQNYGKPQANPKKVADISGGERR
jgi:hypothetical protein